MGAKKISAELAALEQDLEADEDLDQQREDERRRSYQPCEPEPIRFLQ